MLEISSITSFFSQEPTYQKTGSPIDIVLYEISLSSSPQFMESYQEKLREITAKIKPTEKILTTESNKELATLYINIEHYLIEKEPLKKITKTELRKNITEKFNVKAETMAAFWNQLSQE